MVKALFFDLTDTLQEFNWNKQWPLLRQLIKKETNHNLIIEDLKKYYQQAYEVYRLGFINSDEVFFDLMFRMMDLYVPKSQIKKVAKKHLELRGKYTWLPKNYLQTMNELKKHFKLAVVSSGVMPWAYYDFEKFFGFEFDDHFDYIIDSYSNGYLKESGKLFDIVLKKMKLKPNQVAFVGNDYKSDILVAKKHKMKTIFLNKKNENKKGNITIKKLSDLVNNIEKIKKL
jgi:putative hydrolase of the HAD superfamily